jgi:hypothetical protein
MRTVSVGDTIGMLQEFGGVAAGEKCLVIAVSPQLTKRRRASLPGRKIRLRALGAASRGRRANLATSKA